MIFKKYYYKIQKESNLISFKFGETLVCNIVQIIVAKV